MPASDETITHDPAAAARAEGTLAGDGTLDTSPDENATIPGGGTVALDAGASGHEADDRTLAGDGTFADEPEGAVDAERTMFDSAFSEDRTLPGDAPARGPDADGTFMDDPTFQEDRTLVDGPQRRSRQPAEHDTFDDRTLADAGPSFDPDRTVTSDGAVSPVDDDRTMLGDDGPVRGRMDDDRTMIGDEPAGRDDDRTVVGDDRSPRGGDDRTMIGEEDDDATTDSSKPTAKGHDRERDPKKNYDLIEDFARGGMGKIWRAMDLRIRREVAYKELLPNALRSPIVVERFLKEAQVTGQLEHPGIVPIYDLGWQENGTPFYSMKLIRGEPFKKSIEHYHSLPRESGERRLAFVKTLQQFVAICNTLGYAHQRSVLHRDLKPLNIMCGDFGETLVIDWGLARLVNDPDNSPMGDGPVIDLDALSGDADDATAAIEASAPRGGSDDATRSATQAGGTHGTGTHGGTHTGQTTTGARRQSVVTDYASEGSKTVMGSVMGTPAYMPPEQARGLHDQLDARADIYSLGAILYEVLTNRAPIPRGKLPEMLKNVVEGNIEPPRKIDPTIPKPLEAVCMKALAKEKADRYASALDLSREIERWLADEPVTAYQEPWYHQLRRWVRRHRTLVTTSSAVVAFAVFSLIGWNVVEGRRIAGITRTARERIAEAKSAITSAASLADLSRPGELLREAAGLVEAEPALASIKTEIQNDLGDLDRERAARREADLVRRRDRVRSLVADAEKFQGRNELDEALRLLTEARGELGDEPELQELAADIQKRTAALRAEVGTRDARVAAQKKFDRFQEEVDQARFFGSLFSAGSVLEHSKAAKVQSIAALAEYGLDQPNADIPHPEHLTEAQQKSLVESAFETLLILADSEITIAGEATPEAKKEGAEKALAWLERAKSLKVESKVLPYKQAVSWDRLGDRAKRDAALEEANGIEPTAALDWYLLGQEARHFGNLDEALDYYQQALQVDPQYFWALQSIGLCHLKQGRPEAAVASYTAAIASRPNAPPICYLTRAIAFGDLKHQNAALADLKKAEELKADPYELLLNRGGIQFQFSQFEDAVADYEAAIKLRPEQPGPYRNIGNVLRVQGDEVLRTVGMDRAKPLFERALESLATAIEKAPNDAGSHAIRGDILMRLERDAEAAAEFEKAALLDPVPENRAKSYFELGKIHHRNRKWNEALAAYNLSVSNERAPDAPETKKRLADVHRLRAEALNALNKLDEADAAWSKALALGVPIGDIYRGRALARAARGKYRDAMNDFTRSLELEPSPNMLTRRGWAYLLKANQLALDDFNEAIEENPDNPDSYNGRGYARVMMGDYVGAAADAEEAIKKEKLPGKPADWQIFYNAATIFAQAVDRVGKDKSKSDEEREKLAGAMTLRALQTLGETVKAAGTKNQALLLQTIKSDTALDPIRQRPEFLKIFGPKPAT